MIIEYKQKNIDFETQLKLNYSENHKEAFNLKIGKIDQLIKNLEDYNLVLHHKITAYCQRDVYKYQISSKEILKNKIIIEMDYKQKITLGFNNQRQISNEFYKKKTRSCLGFGIYFLEMDEIKLINFDIISYDTSQGGIEVIRGFKVFQNQLFFKKIIRKENININIESIDQLPIKIFDYIIWSDCGPHFRNNILIDFFLKELPKENIHVEINMFGEKHGKSERDVHFSNVTKFIEFESMARNLISSQDIVDSILRRQTMANENKKGICFILNF